MSLIFLAASVASALGSNEPECEPSRSVRLIHGVEPCSESTGLIPHAIPMSARCLALLPMSSAAGFHVSHSAPRLEADGSPMTSGLKCSESLTELGHPTSSPRMSKKRPSPTRLNVSDALATERTAAVYRALIAGRTIKEIVGGPLHTPTRKANFVAPSMQKWPSCRRYVLAFGGQRITPEQFEFLMGFPIGWTALPPSETPSSRKFQKQSGERS